MTHAADELAWNRGLSPTHLYPSKPWANRHDDLYMSKVLEIKPATG